MAKAGSFLKKSFKIYLLFAGIFLSVYVLWAILGLPIFIDRICIRSEEPLEPEYVVCVGAGLTEGNLPTDDGWGRIYTAVQLYLDGYGKKVVFTGGGSGRVSEAEVYSEAARWLGLEERDGVLDPGPNQTSEHPKNIKMIEGAGIGRETRLDIVTSMLHSKRTAMCFVKAGFTNFRLVTAYRATGRRKVEGRIVSRYNAAEYLRDEKKSILPSFKQSDKTYNDVFMRLKWRSAYFFTTLRELAALAAYKVKGLI
jgi:uncharacterized SAM-binding protein YcdF (DUF218 family)